MSKFDVADSIAKLDLKIRKGDFHSCDYSNDQGVPCGECLDCEAIDLIYTLNPLLLQDLV